MRERKVFSKKVEEGKITNETKIKETIQKLDDQMEGLTKDLKKSNSDIKFYFILCLIPPLIFLLYKILFKLLMNSKVLSMIADKIFDVFIDAIVFLKLAKEIIRFVYAVYQLIKTIRKFRKLKKEIQVERKVLSNFLSNIELQKNYILLKYYTSIFQTLQYNLNSLENTLRREKFEAKLIASGKNNPNRYSSSENTEANSIISENYDLKAPEIDLEFDHLSDDSTEIIKIPESHIDMTKLKVVTFGEPNEDDTDALSILDSLDASSVTEPSVHGDGVAYPFVDMKIENQKEREFKEVSKQDFFRNLCAENAEFCFQYFNFIVSSVEEEEFGNSLWNEILVRKTSAPITDPFIYEINSEDGSDLQSYYNKGYRGSRFTFLSKRNALLYRRNFYSKYYVQNIEFLLDGKLQPNPENAIENSKSVFRKAEEMSNGGRHQVLYLPVKLEYDQGEGTNYIFFSFIKVDDFKPLRSINAFNPLVSPVEEDVKEIEAIRGLSAFTAKDAKGWRTSEDTLMSRTYIRNFEYQFERKLYKVNLETMLWSDLADKMHKSFGLKMSDKIIDSCLDLDNFSKLCEKRIKGKKAVEVVHTTGVFKVDFKKELDPKFFKDFIMQLCIVGEESKKLSVRDKKLNFAYDQNSEDVTCQTNEPILDSRPMQITADNHEKDTETQIQEISSKKDVVKTQVCDYYGKLKNLYESESSCIPNPHNYNIAFKISEVKINLTKLDIMTASPFKFWRLLSTKIKALIKKEFFDKEFSLGNFIRKGFKFGRSIVDTRVLDSEDKFVIEEKLSDNLYTIDEFRENFYKNIKELCSNSNYGLDFQKAYNGIIPNELGFFYAQNGVPPNQKLIDKTAKKTKKEQIWDISIKGKRLFGVGYDDECFQAGVLSRRTRFFMPLKKKTPNSRFYFQMINAVHINNLKAYAFKLVDVEDDIEKVIDMKLEVDDEFETENKNAEEEVDVTEEAPVHMEAESEDKVEDLVGDEVEYNEDTDVSSKSIEDYKPTQDIDVPPEEIEESTVRNQYLSKVNPLGYTVRFAPIYKFIFAEIWIKKTYKKADKSEKVMHLVNKKIENLLDNCFVPYWPQTKRDYRNLSEVEENYLKMGVLPNFDPSGDLFATLYYNKKSDISFRLWVQFDYNIAYEEKLLEGECGHKKNKKKHHMTKIIKSKKHRILKKRK